MAFSKIILNGTTLMDVTGDTVAADKLLTGYTATGADGEAVSGSISTKSAQTYTPTTTDQTISSGKYLTGAQTISGDANLVAGNIKKDVSIFGVTGTYEASGGSSYTLLGYKEVTVNTSSTSSTTIDTINIGSDAYSSSYVIYVKVRDKAGIRNGYFVGSDNWYINADAANGSTTYNAQGVTMSTGYKNSTFQRNATTGTTGYGVTTGNISPAGVVDIRVKYNSNLGTLNGTYRVEVYKLDYAPNQGNPFNYSYS